MISEPIGEKFDSKKRPPRGVAFLFAKRLDCGMMKEKGGERMQEENRGFEAMEEALRRSWEIHRQAFGPILEPAFEENPQVRIEN